MRPRSCSGAAATHRSDNEHRPPGNPEPAATVVAVAPVTVRSLRQPAEVPDPAEAEAEAAIPVSVP